MEYARCLAPSTEEQEAAAWESEGGRKRPCRAAPPREQWGGPPPFLPSRTGRVLAPVVAVAAEAVHHQHRGAGVAAALVSDALALPHPVPGKPRGMRWWWRRKPRHKVCGRAPRNAPHCAPPLGSAAFKRVRATLLPTHHGDRLRSACGRRSCTRHHPPDGSAAHPSSVPGRPATSTSCPGATTAAAQRTWSLRGKRLSVSEGTEPQMVGRERGARPFAHLRRATRCERSALPILAALVGPRLSCM